MAEHIPLIYALSSNLTHNITSRLFQGNEKISL